MVEEFHFHSKQLFLDPQEMGEDGATGLPCAWRWLQELGGISEMPLLSGKSLLKGDKAGHILGVALLEKIHTS